MNDNLAIVNIWVNIRTKIRGERICCLNYVITSDKVIFQKK